MKTNGQKKSDERIDKEEAAAVQVAVSIVECTLRPPDGAGSHGRDADRPRFRRSRCCRQSRRSMSLDPAHSAE